MIAREDDPVNEIDQYGFSIFDKGKQWLKDRERQAKEAYERAKREAQEAWNKAQAEARRAYEKAMEIKRQAEELARKAQEAARKAAQAAKNYTSKAYTNAKNAYDNCKKNTKSCANKAADKAKHYYKQTQQKITKITQPIKDTIPPLPTLDEVNKYMKEIGAMGVTVVNAGVSGGLLVTNNPITDSWRAHAEGPNPNDPNNQPNCQYQNSSVCSRKEKENNTEGGSEFAKNINRINLSTTLSLTNIGQDSFKDAGVLKAGSKISKVGNTLSYIGMAVDAAEIIAAEDKVRETYIKTGSWAGASAGSSAGCSVGMATGAKYGPNGTTVGCAIGGTAGGFIGYFGGEEITKKWYDNRQSSPGYNCGTSLWHNSLGGSTRCQYYLNKQEEAYI